MKRIGLACLAVLAACQAPQPAPQAPQPAREVRPLMNAELAAKICTAPKAVSVFGAECVLRDQSPPARLLPPLPIER
jgi:hypothetical protein